MTETAAENALDYVCARCGRKGAGRYVAGGWWQYPFGWLVHDDGERWTCNLVCAQGSRPDWPAVTAPGAAGREDKPSGSK